MKRIVVLVLCTLLSVTVHAEEGGCGPLKRFATRFRAMLISVKPISDGQVTVTPVDYSPQFVVSVNVESVEGEHPELKRGETRHFAVREVSKVLGADDASGQVIELETEWMTCDDVFRNFVGLRKPPAERVVEEPDGWLEVGHTYRAIAKWEDDDLQLETHLRVPYHHGSGYYWTNPDAIPKDARDGSLREVVFELVSLRIDYMGDHRWVSDHELKVISVRKRVIPSREDGEESPESGDSSLRSE